MNTKISNILLAVIIVMSLHFMVSAQQDATPVLPGCKMAEQRKNPENTLQNNNNFNVPILNNDPHEINKNTYENLVEKNKFYNIDNTNNAVMDSINQFQIITVIHNDGTKVIDEYFDVSNEEFIKMTKEKQQTIISNTKYKINIKH